MRFLDPRLTSWLLHFQGEELVQYLQATYLPSLNISPEVTQVRIYLKAFSCWKIYPLLQKYFTMYI